MKIKAFDCKHQKEEFLRGSGSLKTAEIKTGNTLFVFTKMSSIECSNRYLGARSLPYTTDNKVIEIILGLLRHPSNGVILYFPLILSL